MYKFTPERFWARVDRSSTDGCWAWLGARSRNGYGSVSVLGTIRKTHRVAWELTNGPIPSGEGHHGICVMHRCDNRICVRPDHLSLGNHLDNMADCASKMRIARMKLTREQVIEARCRIADGDSERTIARDLGVSGSTVHRAATGEHWRHI